MDRFGVLFDALLSLLAQCNGFLESRWYEMAKAHSAAEAEEKKASGQQSICLVSGHIEAR